MTHPKKRIVLLNSFRPEKDSLIQYKVRGKNNNNKPHYFLNKKGEITELLKGDEVSEYFINPNYKTDIVICMENLGWFEKINGNGKFLNALGIFVENQTPFEKKWRDYFYWDIYPIEQINSLIYNLNLITQKMGIKKNFIGHNTKSIQVDNFNGIVSRSNFNELYTDISPSFPFFDFNKNLNLTEEK